VIMQKENASVPLCTQMMRCSRTILYQKLGVSNCYVPLVPVPRVQRIF
jgi:hypothetical protein